MWSWDKLLSQSIYHLCKWGCELAIENGVDDWATMLTNSKQVKFLWGIRKATEMLN